MSGNTVLLPTTAMPTPLPPLETGRLLVKNNNTDLTYVQSIVGNSALITIPWSICHPLSLTKKPGSLPFPWKCPFVNTYPSRQIFRFKASIQHFHQRRSRIIWTIYQAGIHDEDYHQLLSLNMTGTRNAECVTDKTRAGTPWTIQQQMVRTLTQGHSSVLFFHILAILK